MRRLNHLIVLSCAAAACGGGTPGATGTGHSVCGDSYREGDEQCDLGVFNADNGVCKTDCTFETCGDGIRGPDEACDDGNTDDTDSCTTLCDFPVLCPNGHTDAGEECDDGNYDDTDSCLSNCVSARC